MWCVDDACSLFFAVAGARFLNLSKQFASMPTEEFLAMLLKSKGGAASAVEIGSSVEKGNELDSKKGVANLEMIVDSSVQEASEALLKDKKRHRDGHSSRPHHSKKFKEPMSCLGKDKVPLSAKSGNDVRVRSSVGTQGASDSRVEGLRLCKSYLGRKFIHFCLGLMDLKRLLIILFLL